MSGSKRALDTEWLMNLIALEGLQAGGSVGSEELSGWGDFFAGGWGMP